MRRVELTVIPEPNSHETPYFIPEQAPVASTDEADVEYICGNCGTTLAELPFQVSLSTILGNVEEFEDIETEIHVVQCPRCDSFNEFSHERDNPMKNSSQVPDFDTNLERLLRQSRRLTGDDGFDPEGHFIDPDTHLLNRWDDIFELPLDQLFRFPRYLSDAVFMTSPPRISYDHFNYWGWTAAVAVEHPISRDNDFEDVIREYLSLVHFMLFKQRHINSRLFYTREGISTEIDGKEISWEEAWNVVDWGNPSHEHLSVIPDRYAATTGFAVLEGLINEHCEVLSSEEGHVKSSVESPWHPTQSTLKGEITYHDKLQIWRYYSARDATKETLGLIDDLSRYEPETLYANMAGVEDIVEEELKSTNHFLRVVADQRNANLHGQLATRVIGNLITTLCSLLIWDAIPEEGLNDHLELVRETVETQEDEAFEEVMSAPAFMPVDRVQHLLDVDIVTPSDPRYPEKYRRFQYEDGS